MSGKFKAFLVLIVMYGLGAVSGVAWHTYRVQHHSMRQMYVSRHIRKLKKELHLSPEQEQALREIFGRAHERAKQVNEEVSWDLADIHRDSVDAIHKVLNPEQSDLFDKMHRHSHRDRSLPAEDGVNS